MNNLDSIIDTYAIALRDLAERDGMEEALRVAASTIAFYFAHSSGGMIRDGRPLLVGLKEVSPTNET
ncbi:hypothetical protein LJR231_005920 [Phyllobacterium sp. LjRoot231]|uniref:hypothetical protein n=1 Tax=Phyllobacterium sp. LjRoot231 TaxID=3342289 RepID=UPI003ECC6E6D